MHLPRVCDTAALQRQVAQLQVAELPTKTTKAVNRAKVRHTRACMKELNATGTVAQSKVSRRGRQVNVVCYTEHSDEEGCVQT